VCPQRTRSSNSESAVQKKKSTRRRGRRGDRRESDRSLLTCANSSHGWRSSLAHCVSGRSVHRRSPKLMVRNPSRSVFEVNPVGPKKYRAAPSAQRHHRGLRHEQPFEALFTRIRALRPRSAPTPPPLHISGKPFLRARGHFHQCVFEYERTLAAQSRKPPPSASQVDRSLWAAGRTEHIDKNDARKRALCGGWNSK